MLTFGSIIKSRMTEDFTLFGTLKKVAWSTLNITITTLHPQIWHERKREPWKLDNWSKKTLDVFFFYVYIWNDNTSFLPSVGADAVATSSEWAGHQSGLLLLTVNVTQLFSGSNLTSTWVTNWDCESLLWCALYLIQNALFSKRLFKTQLVEHAVWLLPHMMGLEPTNTYDVLS